MSPNWSLLWTSHLGYTIRTLTDHSNKPGSWSFFLCLDPSWLNKPYSLKTWGTNKKIQKRHIKSQKFEKKHSAFSVPFPLFYLFCLMTQLNWKNKMKKKIKKYLRKKLVIVYNWWTSMVLSWNQTKHCQCRPYFSSLQPWPAILHIIEITISDDSFDLVNAAGEG